MFFQGNVFTAMRYISVKFSTGSLVTPRMNCNLVGHPLTFRLTPSPNKKLV